MASWPWNHNIHYHPLVLRAMPPRCERVLDVGCGRGLLVRQLAARCSHVVAIDPDVETLEHARSLDDESSRIEYKAWDSSMAARRRDADKREDRQWLELTAALLSRNPFARSALRKSSRSTEGISTRFLWLARRKEFASPTRGTRRRPVTRPRPTRVQPAKSESASSPPVPVSQMR